MTNQASQSFPKVPKQVEVPVILGLGSNLGSRKGYLDAALAALKVISTGPIILSSIYETVAMGPGLQQNYLNMAIQFHSKLSPLELFRFCKKVEQELGRLERPRWHPREIDIDILLYGEEIVKSPELQIPHAGLHQRQFVLRPLCEFGSHLNIPGTQQTIFQCLQALEKIEGIRDHKLFNPVDAHAIS